MKPPEVPANEPERLRALASYDVLDTEPEEVFDAVTRLVANTLDVPIALVSLVDADRQWFKSRHGLEVTETSRECSFCGHAAADGLPLIVPDALEDERFADNPLVLGDPRVRFYAGIPLKNPEGHVLGTLCAIDREPRGLSAQQLEMLRLAAKQVVDQLELRRRAIALHGEQARLRTVLESMQEGVVVQLASGEIVECNRAAERILGLGADQMEGRTSTDPRWRAVREDGSLFPGQEHPAMVALATGEPVYGVVMGVHTPEGELRWIAVNAQPMQVGSATRSVVSTFRDITEERRARAEREAMQERLARHERLATTGTLAAGVGHELNNPLMYVIGNLDFGLEELRGIAGVSPSSGLERLIEALEDARTGAERIRKIVQGLRSLARPSTEPVPVDLHQVVEVSIHMAMHELRVKCSVGRDFRDVPPVLGDEARLAQVLVNLLVNAAHAFETADPARNRVTVRTRELGGDRVQLEVIDNGPGIPPDVLPRICDPFFTTKEVGVGTGLGLSICHSVVTSLGGEFACESELNRGTTFRVVLPAACDARSTPDPGRRRARRGRLLVIDDDPPVLRSLARLLRGHEVVALDDAHEALRRIEGGEHFDGVFCDLMMPRMDGLQLYERVRTARPALAERIVFISGGARSARNRELLGSIPNEVLDKPVDTAQIRAIARRLTGAD